MNTLNSQFVNPFMFNQYGCNNPLGYNQFEGIAYGIGNMFINSLFNNISGNSSNKNNNESKSINYKELAEANIDSHFDEDIEKAEDNLETCNSQYTIISDCKTRITEISTEKSSWEAKKLVNGKGHGEDGALTPEDIAYNEKIDAEITRLENEEKQLNSEIDKAVKAINDLAIEGLTISSVTPKSVITTYANNAIKKAKEAKEAAIKEEIEKLKEQDEAEASSPVSKQVAKAQERADKIEAKRLEKEAKAKEKAEKEARAKKEKELAACRKEFNNAMAAAKKTKNTSSVNLILRQVADKKGDADYVALAAAFKRELEAEFPERKISHGI